MIIDDPWEAYIPTVKTGKLCYQYCSQQSMLPIRDVLNDHHQGFKSEPNYETATYNWYFACNQPSIRAAVKDGLSHILFITKYTGFRKEYQGRYFIVGYYEIGWIAKIGKRVAIRARNLCFTPVEKAYEITGERWQQINTQGQTQSLKTLRSATQRIGGPLLDQITRHLDEGNALDDFLHEVSRLKAECNPFEDIPTGRVFIINVGSNTSSPLQSPAFSDDRFELVPIPENDHLGNGDFLTYGELPQFNDPGRKLLHLFPHTRVSPSDRVHNDPEFMTFTYGDNVRQKSNLQDLQKGDYLFFLARLVPYIDNQFQYEKAFFAFVGYFEIAERLDDPHSPLFMSPAFIRNAHVRRYLANPSSFANYAIFKGSTKSRRFRYAVRFDRSFVDHIPILKADGSRWEWDRTTELGIIGSNTRTVRMYIDPRTEAGQEQAKKFWQHIWRVQKWDHRSKLKRISCQIQESPCQSHSNNA